MEYKLLREKLFEYFDELPMYAFYSQYYHILSDTLFNKEFCMCHDKLYVTWDIKNIFFEVDEYGFIIINSNHNFMYKKLSEKPGCKRITAKQAFEFLKRNDNFVKLLKQIYK
jgi:hypothetical protein